MGKKMWSVMFSAVCLALAFGVGSLEAQPTDCEICEKCDRDGDGLIKNSGRCRNLCNPDPVDLDPDASDAGRCSGGDGGSGQTITYDVEARAGDVGCLLNIVVPDNFGPDNFGIQYHARAITIIG